MDLKKTHFNNGFKNETYTFIRALSKTEKINSADRNFSKHPSR